MFVNHIKYAISNISNPEEKKNYNWLGGTNKSKAPKSKINPTPILLQQNI